jgi:hypothetical protein
VKLVEPPAGAAVPSAGYHHQPMVQVSDGSVVGVREPLLQQEGDAPSPADLRRIRREQPDRVQIGGR